MRILPLMFGLSSTCPLLPCEDTDSGRDEAATIPKRVISAAFVYFLKLGYRESHPASSLLGAAFQLLYRHRQRTARTWITSTQLFFHTLLIGDRLF